MRGGCSASGARRATVAALAALLACAGGAHAAVGATQSSLSAVSCPSEGQCVAVGQIAVGAQLRPLAEILRGGRWNAMGVAAVGRSSQLNGVSCVSQSFCMAVGAEPKHGPLTELWNGAVWTPEAVLSPPGAATLDAVSCVSVSFCVAVGSTPLEQPLVELWDGSSWARLASPGSTGTIPELLSGVSCASTTSCVAVGTSFAGGSASALVERYAMGAWRVLRVGLQGQAPALTSVSCATPSWCLAGGSVQATSTGASTALVLRISGVVVRPSSVLASVPSNVYGVSCWSVGRCVAVGDAAPAAASATGASNAESALAQRLQDGAWQTLTPGLVGASDALTGGVSCGPRGACVAVGYAVSRADGAFRPLSQRLVGQRWELLAASAG